MRLAKISFSLILCLFVTALFAQNKYEGDYTKLDTTVSKKELTESNTVVEFFSYGCPHCYDFNSELSQWEQSHPSVKLVRMPVAFGGSWDIYARAYYVADVYGKLDVMSSKIFTAIHVQHKNLGNEDAMQAFFAENGITKAQFDKVYGSAGLNKILKDTQAVFKETGATGVPALLVEGQYLISPTRKIGLNGMLDVADYLLKQSDAK